MLFKKPVMYKILSMTCTGLNDLHLPSITFTPHSNPKEDGFTTLFSMRGGRLDVNSIIFHFKTYALGQ